MSKFKFINFIDLIFISIATFFIIFAWIQFFIRNIIFSLFISALLSIGIIYFARCLRAKKYSTIQKNTALEKTSNLFKLTILTMPNTKLCNLIKQQLPSNYNAKIVKGDILFYKNDTLHSFVFHFSSKLDELELLNLIKSKSCCNLTIFCHSYSQEALNITQNLIDKQIQLISLEQLFAIFNDKNIEIDYVNIKHTYSSKPFKQILQNTLSRNKSKGYFISGLILLFTSLIIPFRIYYVVFSSVLFILSLVCRIKPTIKTNYDIFD